MPVEKSIGIIAVAVGIEGSIVERFRDSLPDNTLYVDIVYDRLYLRGSLLNKSMALNDSIKSYLILDEVILICTDIDMLIPPGLIEHVEDKLEKGTNLWVRCRNIDEADIEPRDWDKWLELPIRTSGMGSFNAMYAEDWIKSGGWDERLIGWGGEDDVFKLRREQAGIKTVICDSFPLMHVNHPPRQNKGTFRGGNQEAIALGMSGEFYNWLI